MKHIVIAVAAFGCSQEHFRRPSEGMVPTCVVQSAAQIRHRLKLTYACKFEVKLEQRVGPR
jgi:hypothetical protein